jgi:hypothetical protein
VRLLSFNKNYLILILVVVVVAAGGYWYLSNQEDTSKVVFKIGVEDDSCEELEHPFYAGKTEYSCVIGVDSVNDTFPCLHQTQIVADKALGQEDDEGVAVISITFSLGNKYDNPVLRLVREGSETTVVSVDDGKEYVITSSMFGSVDGGIYGSYNLELGSLDAGSHTIVLTVADDGKGYGQYTWDALTLYTAPPS